MDKNYASVFADYRTRYFFELLESIFVGYQSCTIKKYFTISKSISLVLEQRMDVETWSE
jgi:hypothetical protein